MESGETPYQYPAGVVEVEHEMRRSRFITRLGPASSRDAAMAFVRETAERYPDARHVCWAFVAGNPAGGAEMGSHDAGEPAGTAGRPMLSVLDHKGLGDVVAVVIRYFGGIKLGAGGLVRAYAAAVQQAVDELPLAWRRPVHTVYLGFGFEHEDRIRRLVASHGGQLEEPDYGQSVGARVRIEERAWPALRDELTQATSGRIEMNEDVRNL